MSSSLFRQLTKTVFRQNVINNKLNFKRTNFQNFFQFQSRTVAHVLQPAPSFSAIAVVNKKFEKINLEDFRGKCVVLFFYPLDFTYVCPTEIIEFNDKAKKFKEHEIVVIGCSVDSQFTHLAWINTPREQGGLGDMQIPIIADLTREIATDFGCLLPDGFTARGTYIIDNNGIVRNIELLDRPVGRNVDEVLRLCLALKYVDKYGEVCPASWKPGDKTIKPDPLGKLAYFESVIHTEDDTLRDVQ